MRNPIRLSVSFVGFLAAASLANAAAALSPYTAEYNFAEILSNPNGTATKDESTEVVAVDGRGRSVHAKITSIGNSFDVLDPAAHKSTQWGTLVKRATVRPLGGDPAKCALAGMLRSVIQHQLAQQKSTVEDLGLKSIAGIEARGTRSTSIDPSVPVDPKEPPLVTVDEKWYAVDVALGGLIVRETSDIAPRHSGWVKQLTSLKRGEPDPQLFTPPSNYEVVTEKATCQLADG